MTEAIMLTVSTPGMGAAAAGPVTVRVAVEDFSGEPIPGHDVVFSGPSGALFSPASVKTNSTGVATVTMDLRTPWAMPGSEVVVNARVGQ